MILKLAIVTAAGPTDCSLRWLDSADPFPARYSDAAQGRIRFCAQQLVAVDAATSPPTVVWRWFRGVVVYRRDAYVVVDNHVYQPGAPLPLSLLRLPDGLGAEVGVGDEVFSSHEPQGDVVDVVVDDAPAHPERIAAMHFPAVLSVYAQRRSNA